jgi:hypothetical protein
MDADGHIPSAREVRRLRKVLRKQAAVMAGVVGDVHPPHPNSILARLDAAAFARETPSVIIMNALVSACAHLSSAHDFIKTSNANRITAWSLLRPTLMSATTAGWILVATNSGERLRRAAVVVNESIRYEVAYARNVDRIPGGQAAERLAWIEERLADLNEWALAAGLQLRGRDRVPMTEAVAQVAASVGAEARISALWNEMSSGAHGLGWHIQSRTFGAGTTALEGSTFVRFPVELDRAYYFGVVANLTDYTSRILSIARALATDRATLEDNGLITIAEDGEWVLRLDL